MIESILRWVARSLAGILERYADPDLQAKLDAYEKRGKELDAARVTLDQKEIAFLARLAASEKDQAEWQLRINEIDKAIDADRHLLAKAQEERKQIADELKKTLADIDTRPDIDRINLPLPGTSQDR